VRTAPAFKTSNGYGATRRTNKHFTLKEWSSCDID